MLIPLWTLPKLRISLTKKLSLLALFTLAFFAIIAAVIRCVISVTDSTSLTKVLIWSAVEETVSMIVANIPILRPLFFRGKNFESSVGNTARLATNRSRYTDHQALPDTYELTNDKKGNVVSVVSADAKKTARNAAPTAADTFGVLRTVEVMVHSEDTRAGHRKGNGEDGSSSNSSLWMP
jgi:Fungal rhodopsin domain